MDSRLTMVRVHHSELLLPAAHLRQAALLWRARGPGCATTGRCSRLGSAIPGWARPKRSTVMDTSATPHRANPKPATGPGPVVPAWADCPAGPASSAEGVTTWNLSLSLSNARPRRPVG